ncbi:MAG: hypothetical protein KGN79_08970 [Acidobacteriota bacterium]|nr:hypothetical protein [Acidobacteriota bacterium]
MALAALTLAVPAFAHAQVQVQGYWQAASDTTASITGDISFGKSKLTINFVSFPLAEIRDLKPAEVSSVFDVDLNAGGIGTLFRINIPASQRFLHKNTLCGTEDTQWLVTFAQGKVLHAAFFSGPEAPVLTFDAMQNSSTHCATFLYVR